MTIDKLIELLKQHIRENYSPSCFRYQQCIDMLDLLKSKLLLCPKIK